MSSSQARYGFPPEAFEPTLLPDFDRRFLEPADLRAFDRALRAPDPLSSPGDDTSSLRSANSGLRSVEMTKRNSWASGVVAVDDDMQALAAGPGDAQSPDSGPTPTQLHTALPGAPGDWSPVQRRILRRRQRSVARGLLGTRTKDETREGYFYQLLKWPLLFFVVGWLTWLAFAYLCTRAYIWLYEHFFAWRGRREALRRTMGEASCYRDWVAAARDLDQFLGRQAWKRDNDFAYYDSRTVRRVWDQMRRARAKAEAREKEAVDGAAGVPGPAEELKALIEACVKNNFVGIENAKLYSQTYYGTKNLVQNFVNEVDKSLRFLMKTKQLEAEEKRLLFQHVCANYGRTALCLSGGAGFALYHLGVIKALVDEDLLPDVITGTSGGALMAALVATRTKEELQRLLVPALAHRLDACSEPMSVWLPRWWRTGARFDATVWAERCAWWTGGSTTFREAYERTGRVLNVTCVPADPHSPSILCNYLTSPDCVIWSAVLASAAVPGILNPVVLMMKRRDGSLGPYSFGHKWKDGSLRTDIPIKALNSHFNVNFTLVSQVNPHISLFFFSPRGTVGHPVTHRKGRGWRGGYLMSATEDYLKLDMNKWLRFIRHAELLPRPLDQDWSQLWLQPFAGTITIWPRTVPSDFWRIVSDPDPQRLARMLHEGQQSTFPKLNFLRNRLRIERLVRQGRRETRPRKGGGLVSEEEDLGRLLAARGLESETTATATTTEEEEGEGEGEGEGEEAGEEGGLKAANGE